MNDMRMGLDVHGVIDKMPEFFSAMSEAMVNYGFQVHIITGHAWTKAFVKELEELGFTEGLNYTHHFSVTDYYREEPAAKVRFDEDGNPWMDKEMWDRAKAKYCLDNDIELHIDDSDAYGKYFKTPYARLTR